ncbi:MAG: site-2 protease family protein [Clostridia bacterium]|nr:site-2 protease family protein [Clostridia bacterium]
MYIKLGKIRLHIGMAFAVFFALAANSLGGHFFVLTFIFSFLHEITHLVCLFYCGCKNAELDFYPGGIKLKAEGFSMLSYDKTVLCTLSAPVMNIFAGTVFYSLGKFFPVSLFYEMSSVNFVIGTGNLLPLPFLDGGRALNAFLLKYLDILKVRKICDICAFFTLLFLIVLFFITLMRGKYYLFLLFFFVYCTVGCFCDKRGVSVT